MNDKIKRLECEPSLHAGLLVHIMRASIGVPRGAIGLSVSASRTGYNGRAPGNHIDIYEVQLTGGPNAGKTVRRLSRDLEVIR